jgi:hypothetical protein
MVSANEIREVVLRYIKGGDAKVFVLDFSKLAFGIGQHGDPQAIELAKAVDGKIALVHAGHLSLPGLREWLVNNAFSNSSTSSDSKMCPCRTFRAASPQWAPPRRALILSAPTPRHFS